MTRRIVLKGIMALSAYIVANPLLATEAKSEEIDYVKLFQEGLDKGVIEDIDFYFTHPIRLEDASDLIIRNCSFVFDYESDVVCMTIDKCDKFDIHDCRFYKKQSADMNTALAIVNDVIGEIVNKPCVITPISRIKLPSIDKKIF